MDVKAEQNTTSDKTISPELSDTGLPDLVTKETQADIEADGVQQPMNDHDAAVLSARKSVKRWRWLLAFTCLWSGSVLYGLDTTIAADVQGPIYESLGNIEKLPWVGLGFPMGSVAVILVLGRSYALFNIKWLTLGSVLLFEAGSALCGAAPTTDALIVGRVIAGIGGSGMYLGALNYISAFATRSKAPIYVAFIGLGWGLGAILGPVVGGAFSESSATWRWVRILQFKHSVVGANRYCRLFTSTSRSPPSSRRYISGSSPHSMFNLPCQQRPSLFPSTGLAQLSMWRS